VDFESKTSQAVAARPATPKLEPVSGGVDAQDPARVVKLLGDDTTGAVYTIKDVAAACRLPGPVIAQLVPRTWVDGVGWMYSGEQVAASVVLGKNLRRFLAWSKAGVCVRCEICGTEPADAADAARWSLRSEPEPQGFCPAHSSPGE
jgi:hypothetical protein